MGLFRKEPIVLKLKYPIAKYDRDNMITELSKAFKRRVIVLPPYLECIELDMKKLRNKHIKVDEEGKYYFMVGDEKHYLYESLGV